MNKGRDHRLQIDAKGQQGDPRPRSTPVAACRLRGQERYPTTSTPATRRQDGSALCDTAAVPDPSAPRVDHHQAAQHAPVETPIETHNPRTTSWEEENGLAATSAAWVLPGNAADGDEGRGHFPVLGFGPRVSAGGGTREKGSLDKSGLMEGDFTLEHQMVGACEMTRSLMRTTQFVVELEMGMTGQNRRSCANSKVPGQPIGSRYNVE